MEILTTRFGRVTLKPEARVVFPEGLVGLPKLKRFVTIPDRQVPKLMWLQSTRDPTWALALVSPRSILPHYQIRATAEQLCPIRPSNRREVDIYVTLNRTAHCIMANMQVPILINRHLGLGMQLPLSDSRYQLRHVVMHKPMPRKSA